MNTILIGYRGTGKSSSGRLVAEMLGEEYLSMDDEIVRRAKLSIPEIVESRGWSFFRELESNLALEVSQRQNVVVDTGGGVIERAVNMERLGASGRVVWLRAGVEIIISRISGDSARPPLREGSSLTDEVREVLRSRTPLYEKYSDFIVDTDCRSPREVAETIIELLGRE